MKKEFVPYGLALELKELGFDEPCFGYYHNLGLHQLLLSQRDLRADNNDSIEYCVAPTYSQAFRWFREKYALCIVIKPIDDKNLELGYNLLKNGLMMGSHPTYEEAELACLQKLIEILQKLIVIVKSR
jgi:hypothetical protein